ncbi:MAG: HAMP domain-containing protein, partial [Roseiflexaceae bacterium]|nr:HAMP domain-containing protein [Roseiflexaceae bacterium]
TQNDLISLGYIAFEDGGVVAFDHDIISKLPREYDPRKRPWYQTARTTGRTVWVDTYVDANTGQLVTTCATPLYGPDGSFVGVVGLDLLLETIKQDILQLDMGELGYAFLINAQGELLVGPNMQPGATEWDQQFITENLLAADDPRLRSVAGRMTDGDEGVQRLKTEQGDIYLAYAPIEYSGWSVGMVVPEATVSGPAAAVGNGIAERQERLRSQVYLVMVLSVIALPVVGVLLTLLVTRPLRRLQLGAQRITAGDLDHQIPVESHDEIGDLVRSFNAMTVALRLQLAELEDSLRRLATLNEVSNRFKTIVAMPDLLDSIPRAVCDDLGFDRSVLYLLDGNQLRCVSACFGQGADAMARSFVAAANLEPITLDSATVEADIVQSGQAVIVDDPWTHPRVLQAKQRISRSDAYVQVPIFGHDEKIVGLLSADYNTRRLPITPRDAAQLLTYASVAGLTIENTRLYNDLEHQVAQRTIELRAALERAQEADRLKGKFLAAISHELRTPLNAIIGFSTVMIDELDGPITPMQREDLKTIHQNGRFLLHMINELLDLARIEANKVELNLEAFDLSALISEVGDTVQGLLHNKPLLIRTVLPEQPTLAYADRAKTRQILLNLLSNAVKFTNEGHIAIVARAVTMSAERGGGAGSRPFLAISVRDTGIGIAAENLPLLFEEFRQVHAGRTGTRGSGLGLAITRKLVELLGGRMWVESTLGKGSTFTFILPAAEAEVARESEPQLLLAETT